MNGGCRVVRADNPGPFTLDGTRTHVVGRNDLAVVDPGPPREDHVKALLRLLEGAGHVTLLVTHGHADHAGALEPLSNALEKRGVPTTVRGAGHPEAGALGDGEAVSTDAGSLVALSTPGHTSDHLVFHWPDRRALFAGDLLMGEGDTTLVAGYSGCVADYLASLARVRALELDVILPAHGPPLEDPRDALDRFEDHRRMRIARVREARAAHPEATAQMLLEAVYGSTVPAGLTGAALRSLEAVLEYVEAHPGG